MGHQHAFLPAQGKLLTPSSGNLPICRLGECQSNVGFDPASRSRDVLGKELGCFILVKKVVPVNIKCVIEVPVESAYLVEIGSSVSET